MWFYDDYEWNRPSQYEKLCPLSDGKLQDFEYLALGKMPLSHHQILEQNGVKAVIMDNEWFDQGIYDKTQSLTPSLYARRALWFNETCDAEGQSRH